MDIGFIGLGQMGSAIALNLVKAGHRLVVWNRSAEKAEPLVRAGSRRAAKAADCPTAESFHDAGRRSGRRKRGLR
jgi:3-hydroxyisobutyrate dehydrogenase-like beta-hydroxyacid dehydrogenase